MISKWSNMGEGLFIPVSLFLCICLTFSATESQKCWEETKVEQVSLALLLLQRCRWGGLGSLGPAASAPRAEAFTAAHTAERQRLTTVTLAASNPEPLRPLEDLHSNVKMPLPATTVSSMRRKR